MSENFDPLTLTELPFGFQGRIFRSPMPFRPGDEAGELFTRIKNLGVQVIVVLAPRQEYLAQTGLDLVQRYQEAGIETIEMPVEDFSVPNPEVLDQTLDLVITKARSGSNVVVHCQAGYGRTGTFMACLAVRALGLDGGQAIRWVRRYIPPALENRDQIEFVLEYGKRNAHH